MDFEGFSFDDFKVTKIQIPCDNSNPPTGLTADVTTTALSAIINWNPIPSATYDLRYREIGASSWTEITDLATNTYTISGLVNDTDYEVQVSTRCTLASSIYSSSVNFTATACTGASISSFPYSESFEANFGLWNQGLNGTDDNIDWTRNSGGTPSITSGPTGPSGASNGNQYIFVESSSPNNPSKKAFLNSPCFELDGYENTELIFDYHMFGSTMGTLKVEVTNDNGLTYTSVFTVSGQQQTSASAAWTTQNINLNSYDGQTIKIRFSGTTGSSFASDIAVDNIKINANAVTLTTWYQDLDSDAFGNPSVSINAVSQPTGYVDNNTDCDDNDNTINPNTVWYVGVDTDGDGFFGSTTSVTQCTSPGAGYSTTAQTTNDCDDNDNTINPNTVWYIGVDNDGDGFFGSTTSVTQCSSPGAGYSTTAQTTNDCDDNDNTINPNTVWYIGVDTDGDGFFGSTTSVTQCTSPGAGYSTTAQTTNDCDDNDNTINPNTVWYIGVDTDGDGFFGSTTSVTQCSSPGAGYSTTAQTTNDCDDNDNTINPNTVWYIGVDTDGDGFFGSTTSVTQCSSPGAGYSTTPQTTNDCDDNDNTINPNTVWYVGVDTDGDGFFGSTTSVTQCTSPGAGYSTTPQTTNDCDDNDNTINPNTVWYIGVDTDGDGFFGSTTSVTQCSSPGAGYSTTPQTTNDCDDNDNTINPNTVWYVGVDTDGDGFFGSTTSVTQCTSPGAGYSTTPQTTNDCDDNDNTINPNTVWYIGVDNDGDGFFGSTTSVTQCSSPGAGYSTTPQTTNDCDDNDNTINPNTVWYVGVDTDGDGFFVSTTSVTQCTSPGAGYSTTPQTTNDCDDNDNTINPNTVWYVGVDNDGDGFFGSTTSVTQCSSPGAGYSTTPQTTNDCDDNDNTINPNTVWYVGVDTDGDGFFGSTNSVTQCSSPGAGYSTTPQTTNDCDDNDNTINPGAIDIPNDGIDQDCNGYDEKTLNIEVLDMNTIMVTPNPFSNYIKIILPKFKEYSSFDIKIFDLNGRLVYIKDVNNTSSSITIDGFENLEQAPYIIKVLNKKTGDVLIRRILKK
ncbi:MopE-related protein [Siansivirga zeaxanthinifaciens]|uniref:Fibronectin type-III domain-containing protein n=1 Tax=Siansivirga zeaxanthinifaciens CC-SAMT-1 TaxID=1454006 RepID=A0A0C5WFE1_9FLAO|nr:fibronectin type III domain-containing protein [Siansivirga zeaxanthinifaciens]AJR04917.1 hypothetical protein AW14_09785 [Siansivirga zeaxanthinifaciens CC-SAMT-1]